MTAVEFFAAARAHKRAMTGNSLDGLTQAEVDALNAVVSKWKRKTETATKTLTDPQAFFKSVKAAFGSLTQEQVDGFNALLKAMAGWKRSWVAYGLATAWHETARTMQPVEEAFWKDDAWRSRNLRYYPHHGRGYVQLTWPRNYQWADDECGLNGALIADLKLAMNPEIAARIMVKGMEHGAFTGKKLADYLGDDPTHDDFAAARKIINGTDKKDKIAKEAIAFSNALEAGGWA
jgi:putative chitinase